ncbi:MAG: hypothetical protein ACTSO9_09505 [Candidatus Helarchaeota archaeon]
MSREWQRTKVEKYVPPFAEKWSRVTPKHPAWKDRIKLEVHLLKKYLDFLKSEGAQPWFLLRPNTDPRKGYMEWNGYLRIPQRPELTFKIIILLPPEYPQSCPRCFIEKKISRYCGGKLYLKNKVTDEQGNIYVMMCHDHMKELDAWMPILGIAHFFLREVWYWWSAQVNFIISQYDKEKGKA